MSNNDGPAFNDTILRIVNNYKKGSVRERIFDYNTPKKRSSSPTSSTSSSEINSAVKKFKADNQIVCAGSPREFRRLKCELIESRNYAKELENQLTHLRAIKREEQIDFERETKRWKAQAERDRKTIGELETKLDDFRRRELACKTELNEAKAQFARTKASMEMKLHTLDVQFTNLKEEVHDQSTDENTKIIQLERQNEELQIMYKAAKEDTEAHKKFVDELTLKLKAKTNCENELEIKTQALNKALQQIQKMEFNKESYLEYQQQAKNQQQKLTNYESLERENAQLREENSSLKQDVHHKLLLEEEVHDIKGRLQKYKELDKTLNTLMVTNAQNEMHLEEFRTLARSICETSNSDTTLPRLLRTAVERLQHQEITLTSDKIQLDSALSTAMHEAKVAKDELDKCRSHILTLDKDTKQAKAQMIRMQRKLQLVTGERDSYRKQLDSYEKDLTICINPASLANPGAAQIESQFERIKNLERTVDEYRDMVHKLESDLKSVEGYSTDNIPIRAEKLARLQSEVAKLKADNDLLRQRKDKLEIQLEGFLVGEDVAYGRIVHNSNNPLSNIIKQREQEKQRLEEDVISLKRKIKKMEDGLEASRLGDITIDHREVQNLKEKLAAAENNVVRLKEYFKKAVQDMRDVTYLLFGYKVDMNQSQYTITSMYAEKTEDVLSFHLSKEGAFNLMENEYSSSLEEMVDLHLRQQRSIPVFLSSLTLDLYNTQTMTKAYDIQEDDDVEDDEDEEEEEEDDDVEDDNTEEED